MNSAHAANVPSDIRKTRYTLLKEQQRSLNMRIRLAMQIHDVQTQEKLEKELKEISEEINRII